MPPYRKGCVRTQKFFGESLPLRHLSPVTTILTCIYRSTLPSSEKELKNSPVGLTLQSPVENWQITSRLPENSPEPIAYCSHFGRMLFFGRVNLLIAQVKLLTGTNCTRVALILLSNSAPMPKLAPVTRAHLSRKTSAFAIANMIAKSAASAVRKVSAVA